VELLVLGQEVNPSATDVLEWMSDDHRAAPDWLMVGPLALVSPAPVTASTSGLGNRHR
jgi:hypothetical protein